MDMNKRHELGQTPAHIRRRILASAICTLGATGAHAVEFDTGNPDLTVRLDNSVKASTLYRLKDANPVLANSFVNGAPSALNLNAGDDNFRNKGFVSERVDLLPEFDLVYQKTFGMRVSGAAWYDHAVRNSTKATDTFNGQTPYNSLPDYTRREAGRKAELMDAFVFGGWDLGDDKKLTVRLGRHALQWGESLFYGDNAIARAQGPIDIYKLLASPNAQFKEIIRPVPQVSTQLQLSSDVSVGGYYQFGWEADRLPPAGSYFSTSNIPWGKSPYPELINLGPPLGAYQLTPDGDHKPSRSGQFGLQLKWRVDDTDLGFYFARYHDKGGQLYGQINPAGTPDAAGNLPGSWYYAFPKGVRVVGVSASHSFGDYNVSVEGSIRDNMPLRNLGMLYGFFPGQPAPTPATGRTAHLNLSWLGIYGPNFLANESGLVGEIAWNRVLSKTDPEQMLDTGRTRDATAIQLVYTMTYRQVLPGLDINIPLGVRYTIDGNSSVTSWDAKKIGSWTLGLAGNYLGAWQLSASYTNYFGKAAPYINYAPANGGPPNLGLGNSLADRDFLALSVSRTF
ncbi:DUF1302 domain-containing protein [Methylibium sp.]|uniref:DUF1302 domain-containing protein n=1 Tax=Methylibium sp. TaxID=2067992 RepID=UPI003D0B5C18